MLFLFYTGGVCVHSVLFISSCILQFYRYFVVKKSVCWPSSFLMIRYEVACDTLLCAFSPQTFVSSATNEDVTIFTISLKTLAVRMLEFENNPNPNPKPIQMHL